MHSGDSYTFMKLLCHREKKMKRTKFAFVIKYFVDYNKIFTELTDCTMKLSRINAYTRHLNGNNF